MLAIARVQTQLRLNADVARQRSEAVRLAQEDLGAAARLRRARGAPGVRASYATSPTPTRTVDAASGDASDTAYLVARRIDAAATPHAKNAPVTVGWTDRSGSDAAGRAGVGDRGQRPGLSAARWRWPQRHAGQCARHGRSVRIPLAAKDLGRRPQRIQAGRRRHGRVRVRQPHRRSVTGRCTGVDPATATRDLTCASLGACDTHVGHLLSGMVRFASASPPDPAQANDLPPALTMALTLSGGSYPLAPSCSVEALKTVSYIAAGSLHVEAVPIAATPASLGLPGWTETGERFVAYHCVVYPAASGQWSGRTTLVPAGWTIGTGPLDRRVCRYASDLDGSGAIDANLEHPAELRRRRQQPAEPELSRGRRHRRLPDGAAARVAGNNADVLRRPEHRAPPAMSDRPADPRCAKHWPSRSARSACREPNPRVGCVHHGRRRPRHRPRPHAAGRRPARRGDGLARCAVARRERARRDRLGHAGAVRAPRPHAAVLRRADRRRRRARRDGDPGPVPARRRPGRCAAARGRHRRGRGRTRRRGARAEHRLLLAHASAAGPGCA